MTEMTIKTLFYMYIYIFKGIQASLKTKSWSLLIAVCTFVYLFCVYNTSLSQPMKLCLYLLKDNLSFSIIILWATSMPNAAVHLHENNVLTLLCQMTLSFVNDSLTHSNTFHRVVVAKIRGGKNNLYVSHIEFRIFCMFATNKGMDLDVLNGLSSLILWFCVYFFKTVSL